MSSPSRFFFIGPLSAGSRVSLPADQSHHLVKVLRAKIGTPVELVDGKGMIARGKVTLANAGSASIEIESVSVIDSSSAITLAFAIPKGAALDFIFRKCSELGLKYFQPLSTKHSLAIDRWNQERWDKVVHEVIKQSQAAHAPVVLPPLSLGEWLSRRDPSQRLYFCDEEERKGESTTTSGGIDVLVGAEGGWSEEERRAVQEAGAIALGLGEQRLRAETACLVALVLCKKLRGEL